MRQNNEMKFQLNTKQRLMSLAVASACAAFVVPAYAEDAAAPAGAADAPQIVVVTGIRASMKSTLNLKRDSDGIVDGIVAEDIGKFPDTNLAESLQRISGVSIDRSNGEGQKVTVRGMGPDFNLVLLNGRQMPVTSLSDTSGRSFDFSNLASEAISQMQVFKTGRADQPTGGIGATINIMTARPFDNPGMHASVGVKAVDDTSNSHLPDGIKAKSLTPEMSGLYSNTSEDGRFGVLLSGSYQSRNLGFNQAHAANGFQGPYLGSDTTAGKTLPQPTDPLAGNVTNRPGPNDLYGIPQNFGYAVNGVQRQRTNSQLVFQFKPNNEITTTLDYTFSENKLQTLRNELSVWFSQTPTSVSSWPSGRVVTPLVYSETYNTFQDISVIGGDYATKTKNQSTGFNTVWKASPALKLELDAHHSTAVSGSDSPYGSSNDLSNASFSRGKTTVDFTSTLPILSMPPADLVNHPIQAAGSYFQNSYEIATVNQVQANGTWKVMESSKLNFGLDFTSSENRSTFSNVQNNTWGGGGVAGTPADYPGSLFHANSLPQYFSNIPGHNNPNLFQTLYTYNFNAVRQTTANVVGNQAAYLPNTTTNDSDQRIKENTTAAYAAFNSNWDTAVPMHSSFGLRFEKTKVTAVDQVLPAISETWTAQNEIPVTFGSSSLTSQTASYNNVLPNINLDWDLRSDVKLRASAGETITRARYDQMQGGVIMGTISNALNGGTASSGNPALKPVLSKNLDLSAEWYYDKESLVSAGLFRKNLDNYAGTTVIKQPLYGIHTPIGGAYYNAAIGSGCSVADTTCIRNYIFTNFNGQPGVAQTGPANAGLIPGTILGLASDPLESFATKTYSNQKKANINGVELNVQHMFGRSGFGVLGNFTYVHSPLKYDNYATNNQFAILGLSNSANLVGIYEDQQWSVRIAYNWRDSFLSSLGDGGGNPNPTYTKAYGQLDTSVSYNLNKNLSFQFETINLTNAIQKQYGRDDLATLSVIQTGPRYMVGARYKF